MYNRKKVFNLKKDKKKALELLKQKKNGESKYTYDTISQQTGYSKRQLIRLSQLQEKGGTESVLTHWLTNKRSNNSASRQEIEYIKKFKEKYPNISI